MAVWAKNHKARTIWFSRGRGLNFTSSWKFFSLASRARLFFSLIYFFPLHTMEQKFDGSSFFFKCKKLKSDYFFNQCAGQKFFLIKIRARMFFWKISKTIIFSDILFVHFLFHSIHYHIGLKCKFSIL